MLFRRVVAFTIFILFLSLVVSAQEVSFVDFSKLLPFHETKRAPGPYDWLAQHREPGQQYSQYISQNPVIPTKDRQTIYIMLLGDFDEKQKEVVDLTAEFMRLYFDMPVKFTNPVSLEEIPKSARRIHPQTKDSQILSTYVLEEVLIPHLPKDAFCVTAFTSSDLWPGDGWNFVFGQASPVDRVGVWSIYRNGDPSKSEEDFKLCLKRTMKVGVHETGHVFSLEHCIYFECLLNGSNHRKESDSQPLWLCPVCLKKLQWAVGFDIVNRYKTLIEFYTKVGFLEEKKFLEKSIDALIQ